MSFSLFVLGLLIGWVCHILIPRADPLHEIAGPPYRRRGEARLLDALISPKIYDIYVRVYGRSISVWGTMPWERRLLTLDPQSIKHILTSPMYEKPRNSRDLFSLLSCRMGMTSAVGHDYKRQRRLVVPALSRQYVQGLLPLFFKKGDQLKEKWMGLFSEGAQTYEGVTVDVYNELKTVMHEVMGHAAFDCDLNADQGELHKLLRAQSDLWNLILFQGSYWGFMIASYCPWMFKFIPSEYGKSIRRHQSTIRSISHRLIQEKKRKIEDAAANGNTYEGNDFLSRLLKSNYTKDLAPEDRCSDDDIYNSLEALLLAASSDITTISLSWTLYYLMQNPDSQTRLRNELLSVAPVVSISKLTEGEIHALSDNISKLPYLDKAIKESLRLTPPLRTSLRVPTQDDEVPTLYPVYDRRGNIIEGKKSVTVPKGTVVYCALEGFNIDKEVWGEDAWEFNPDRWDDLPEKVKELPGKMTHLLSFSVGPRACPGMHFSMIKMKLALYILLTSFVFMPTAAEIGRVSLIMTYPYVIKRYKAGFQLPMTVKPFRKANITGEKATSVIQ